MTILLLIVMLPGWSPVSASGSIPGTWAPTGSMVAVRQWQTATLLPNGLVLVAGGNDNATGALSSAELYDPSTGAWTPTGSMATPRYQHTATLLANGKVLVAGGCCGTGSLSSAELYDPSTGTWTATGSMVVGRYNHTATLLPDGRVLVAGGLSSCNPLLCDTSSTELYDPSTGTWTATGSMITPRDTHTATLLPGGQVLVAGGGCIPAHKDSGHVAAMSDPGCSGYLASAELYNPRSGTWMDTGSMATPRLGHTATLLSTGQVLVAGGDNSVSGPLSSAELYQEPLTVYWDKPPQSLGTAQSNMLGSFYGASGVSITVPMSATAGWHLVYVVGQTTHAVAINAFQVR